MLNDTECRGHTVIGTPRVYFRELISFEDGDWGARFYINRFTVGDLFNEPQVSLPTTFHCTI